MEAYSKEFRRDVLRECDSGKRTREVATKFNISESWVRRIKQERRETGKIAPATTRNRQPKWIYTPMRSRRLWLKNQIEPLPS